MTHNPGCAEALVLYKGEIDRLRAELAEEIDRLAKMCDARNTQIDRLRAELAELQAYCNCDERIDIGHADALNAIARVRELPGLNQTTLSVLAKSVLGALDGGTE